MAASLCSKMLRRYGRACSDPCAALSVTGAGPRVASEGIAGSGAISGTAVGAAGAGGKRAAWPSCGSGGRGAGTTAGRVGAGGRAKGAGGARTGVGMTAICGAWGNGAGTGARSGEIDGATMERWHRR